MNMMSVIKELQNKVFYIGISTAVVDVTLLCIINTFYKFMYVSASNFTLGVFKCNSYNSRYKCSSIMFVINANSMKFINLL